MNHSTLGSRVMKKKIPRGRRGRRAQVWSARFAVVKYYRRDSPDRYNSQFISSYFAEVYSDSEEGSCLRSKDL